jgi:hypothetical protein
MSEQKQTKTQTEAPKTEVNEKRLSRKVKFLKNGSPYGLAYFEGDTAQITLEESRFAKLTEKGVFILF